MRNLIVALIINALYSSYKINFQGINKPASEVDKSVFFVKKSNAKHSKAEFDIICIHNDTLFSAVKGSGIIFSKKYIKFFPENGYITTVGAISSGAQSSCLSYSLARRTIAIVGEVLPKNPISKPLYYKSNYVIRIGDDSYVKMPSDMIDLSLKKHLLNPNIRKNTNFVFKCF